jgi:hypothetical protein
MATRAAQIQEFLAKHSPEVAAQWQALRQPATQAIVRTSGMEPI